MLVWSENNGNTYIDHMYWTNIIPSFHHENKRGDQFGKNLEKLLHVFVTPIKPKSHPVLFLSHFILSNICVLAEGVTENLQRNG